MSDTVILLLYWTLKFWWRERILLGLFCSMSPLGLGFEFLLLCFLFGSGPIDQVDCSWTLKSLMVDFFYVLWYGSRLTYNFAEACRQLFSLWSYFVMERLKVSEHHVFQSLRKQVISNSLTIWSKNMFVSCQKSKPYWNLEERK